MAEFHRICYNRLILPLLWGGSNVFSLFNEKVRVGLRERHGLSERARNFRMRTLDRPVILFHCASAGELEALKPIAAQINRNAVALAVSFFSPSARAAAMKSQKFDFADYSPIDLTSHVEAYLDAIRPSIIAITKHDVWPNFVWEAKRRGIPLLLINGNFHSKSAKMWLGLRQFHAAVYSSFTEIMTVSEEDAQNAKRIAGERVSVVAVGDARFDRVLNRHDRRQTLPDGVEAYCKDRPVMVAGSTHADDEELLIPVIKKLALVFPNFLMIVVPHEASPRAAKRIRQLCRMHGIEPCDLDDGMAGRNCPVLLINRTGILADLYRVGSIAYVGGGFGKGVHSVLEPMAAGLPVLCGPHIVVSHEARLAQKEQILVVVKGRNHVEKVIREWMPNGQLPNALAERTQKFVRTHSGVSKLITQRLMAHING